MTAASCGTFSEWLAVNTDDQSPSSQALAFLAHLERCVACRRVAESAARLVKLERAAFRTPEPALPESLVQAILAARRGLFGAVPAATV